MNPSAASPSPLQPGLMVLHGNRPEDLRALLIAWLRQHPLAPLENEVVLVQSNGIAQWLKLALAAHPDDPAGGGLGITAAMELQLPAQFLWRAYRAVLGRSDVPERSPLDEAPLTWRLMRLLPTLLDEPGFEPLARFLAGGAPGAGDEDIRARKRHQLAQRLADLFDQYQVYRADWLQDWAEGRDQLRTLRHGDRPLPPDQRWQAQLWRALLAEVGPAGQAGSRAGVHQRFIAALADAQQQKDAPRPPALPRRVVVFGISALPAQTLQALQALAGHMQVMLFVHNPCRHHWSDIVADQDLLRGAYKRQARRPGMPAVLDEAALHQHAHPLLAAWGKQGRDYLHLVDSIDEPDRYRAAWQGVGAGRIDLFSDDEEAAPGLLQQLQDDILNLRPLAETRALWPAVVPAQDVSLRFHSAHSAQREVEVLHDQLLARFDADPTLQPRDVIVMLPAVDGYAPHIEAVFGRLPRSDPRHIPYTVADQGQRGQEPLLVALELLLRLPESRLAASDVLDLLDVGALRLRFALADEALPTLKRWIAGAGARWGLDAAQRESQALGAAGEVNSWRFGLARMLLGFAVGEGEAFEGIEPYGEVGGLDAAALGPLAALLRALEETLNGLQAPATPTQWAESLRALLARFFAPAEPREQLRVQQLQQGLDDWLDECADAGFSEALPLAVVRERWLAALERQGLQQRFMTGGVSFCTLMPMRAIPFRVVCLLGMNDGDFPRPSVRADFDLMQGDWRPGDRSRRDDDRYLLLEALLSAREQLYISWVGRDVRDHSERAPSVLIGQLRDHVAAGWRLAGHDDQPGALLDALHTEHPLQPFSPRYFTPGAPQAPALDGLYSYGREWQAAHGDQAAQADDALLLLPPLQPERPLSLRQLADFLAQPVDAFFAQRLQVRFDPGEDEAPDEEVFALDGLQNWQLEAELRAALQSWADAQPTPEAARTRIAAELAARTGPLLRAGRLPLQAFGTLAAERLRHALQRTMAHYLEARARWPQPEAQPHILRWQDAASGLAIEDSLPLRHLPAETLAQAEDDAPTPACIVLASGRLHRGDELSWQHIVRHWPAHLALQIAAGPTRTVLASETGLVRLAPLPRAQAQATLAALLQGWAQGMRQPLPLACRTGFMALNEEGEAGRRTRQAYDGDFQRSGEGARPAPARVYEDFAQLLAVRAPQGEGSAFWHWTQQLYRPLWDALESARPPLAESGGGDASGADA
ncbi:exodeoxyribonuclease V subunit gamma [Xenophilus arseniciresistens]|uniref:RecBCD enzyme subunit RecC n=1 Tax=Xenophilus arseniciresistens TaxID=1283306 RepID=A0AAE3NB33_9BURK|nr:exodeoxyribonuclease V subunit gamma [Xenophilus arseniciresistens]MDA7418381.1 exodeoxyribonuclease V subunit gamma [Xenophilus arseniciresistens]